ncbi:MAG: TonB-dependent receptor [Woeseiaceae bacterium]|nr:TonB-dependent receptor [Woeseiaceae bacterium]
MTSKKHSTLRRRLAAGIALSMSLAVSPQLLAQTVEEDADQEPVEEAEQVEEVIVTGSRVARDTFSSISPLQVIDGEVARDLGLVDTADLLRQTTVVQGQQFNTGLTTSAGLLTDSGPGSSTASLRGLDAGRTLVLINGRRLAPAGVGGAPSAPDLNLVPGTLIERVDVLLDGASSVYGSDAVAGVVNVVLRTDFDGLQLDAFRSFTSLPDSAADQQVYTATWGVNDDRGFIGFAAEYAYTDGFAERDLAGFYSPYAGDCLSRITQGASGLLYESCSGSFGAGAASTSAFGFLGFEEGTQEAGLPPGFFRIPVTADLLTPGSANGAALLLWPEELDAAFAPNFKRTSVFSVGEYAPGWYGDATAYFEASYSSRETATNTAGQGRVRIPGDYAVGNFGGLSGTLYYQSRFIRDTEVSQTRVTGGLKGDLPFIDFGSVTDWQYDTYISYSRSVGNDRISGIPFFPRLEQTINNTRFDTDTGEFVCDNRTIAGEAQPVSCRPLNFFDPTFIQTGRFPDADDNAYLFPNRLTNTIVEQTTFQGFITGELFEIPTGGPASLVFGLEYRDDRIRTDTDAGAAGGDFFGFSSDPGSNGTRYLQEIFTEVDLPLVLDRDYVQELSLNIAARYTDEEFFGEETTYRVQGQYAPVDWFRFRATQGTSFRAPNLGEQFGGQVTGFQTPNDPCRVPGVAVPFVDDDDDPATPDIRLYDPSLDPREQVVIDNCANGGGPFNIPATDPFELGIRGLGTQNPVFFGAPTLVASGSNPNLKAETSTATTFGIVFEQPWSDRFDLRFSANYFDIEIEDEVDQLTAITIAGRCYNSPGLVDATCGFITRDPRVPTDDTSGEISFISALQQNLGKQVAEGIDYNVDFNMDFNAFNLESPVNWNVILFATESLTQTEEEFRADEIFLDDDLGEYGNPQWRANLTNIFTYGDWSFLWQTRFLGTQIEDNDDEPDEQTSGFNPCVQAGDGPCLSLEKLDEYFVHDVSATWRSDSWVVRLGVTNLFDEPPPLTDNNTLGLLGGIGYDLRGRTVFLNVSTGL